MWIVAIHETNMIGIHPGLWLNTMIHDLNQFWWMCLSPKSLKLILMIRAHPWLNSMIHNLKFESIFPEINKIDFNNLCPSLNMIRANHVNRAHPWNKYDSCPSLAKHDDLRFESILMNVPIPEINKIDFNDSCPSLTKLDDSKFEIWINFDECAHPWNQ